jgi:AcrR family transcriptional regulator
VAARPPVATPRRRGRPPRSDEARAAHRTRLLEAAIAAIREQGPDVSVDDLAAAAGVSKPVLYDEFGGRLGIADAIALVVAEQIERQVLDVLAAAAFDLEVAVRAVIEGLVDFIDDEPALHVFLVRSIRNPSRGLLDNALLTVMHERATVLVGFITPGVPEAELRILTDGLFGFVLASVESWQATKQPAKAELVDALTRVIRMGFGGVAPDP